MRTLTKITLSAILVIMFSSAIKAQESEIKFNSMVIGREYQIKIENGWETEGVLISNDSNSIKIKSETKTFTIEKAEIIDVIDSKSNKVLGHISRKDSFGTRSDEKNVSEIEKGKIYLSAGIGIGFPLLLNEITYDRVSTSGINLQLNITKVLQGFAIRGDFQYSYYKTKNEDAYYGRGFTANRGANPNVVAGEAVYPEGHAFINSSLNFDFLFGGFKSNKEVNPYAIAGGGLNILSSSFGGGGAFLFNLNLGGGLNYKYSDKIRFYAETEYSFPVILGLTGITYEGIRYGSPSLRAGIQFEL